MAGDLVNTLGSGALPFDELAPASTRLYTSTAVVSNLTMNIYI